MNRSGEVRETSSKDLIDGIREGTTRIKVLDIQFPKPTIFPTEWKTDNRGRERRFCLGEVIYSPSFFEGIVRAFAALFKRPLAPRRFASCRWCRSPLHKLYVEERHLHLGINEQIYEDIEIVDPFAERYCVVCGHREEVYREYYTADGVWI